MPDYRDYQLTDEDIGAVLKARHAAEEALEVRRISDDTPTRDDCVTEVEDVLGATLCVSASPSPLGTKHTIWRVKLRKKGELPLFSFRCEHTCIPYQIITYIANILRARPDRDGIAQLPQPPEGGRTDG